MYQPIDVLFDNELYSDSDRESVAYDNAVSDDSDNDYNDNDIEDEPSINIYDNRPMNFINKITKTLKKSRAHIIKAKQRVPSSVICKPGVTVPTRSISRVAKTNASSAISKILCKQKTKQFGFDFLPYRPIHSFLSLQDFGISVPPLYYKLQSRDKYFINNYNLLVKLPAETCVFDLLVNYTYENKIELRTMCMVLATFGELSEMYDGFTSKSEKKQFRDMKKKYPYHKLYELLGLSHLIRFFANLPGLLRRVHKFRAGCSKLCKFVDGFLAFMVEEKMNLDIDTDYISILSVYPTITSGIIDSIIE